MILFKSGCKGKDNTYRLSAYVSCQPPITVHHHFVPRIDVVSNRLGKLPIYPGEMDYANERR
jgi:hypothetical protein